MVVKGAEFAELSRTSLNIGAHAMVDSLRSRMLEAGSGAVEFSKLFVNGVKNLERGYKAYLAVGALSVAAMALTSCIRAGQDVISANTPEALAVAAQGDPNYSLEPICKSGWGSADINTKGVDTIFVRVTDNNYNGMTKTLSLQKQVPAYGVNDYLTVREFKGQKEVELGQAETVTSRVQTANMTLYELSGPAFRISTKVAEYPEMRLTCGPQ